MLIHLREDCTNIQMDFTGVADDQSLLDPSFVHGLFGRIVDALVLDLKCLFEILKSVSKLFGLSEQTSIIIVGYGSDPRTIFTLRIQLGLLEQILCHFIVFSVKMSHRENITNDSNFFAYIFLFK